MSRINIEALTEKLSSTGNASVSVRHILEHLAPVLNMVISEMDHTDVPYSVGGRDYEDGTQFHITLLEEDAEKFHQDLRDLKTFLQIKDDEEA